LPAAQAALDGFDSDFLDSEVLSLEEDVEVDGRRIFQFKSANEHDITAIYKDRLLTCIDRSWGYRVFFCVYGDKVCISEITRRDISNWRLMM
jgi:hypothetical protein